MKVYIVYRDSYETGLSEPLFVFLTKELAEKMCDEKNKRFTSIYQSIYLYKEFTIEEQNAS